MFTNICADYKLIKTQYSLSHVHNIMDKRCENHLGYIDSRKITPHISLIHPNIPYSSSKTRAEVQCTLQNVFNYTGNIPCSIRKETSAKGIYTVMRQSSLRNFQYIQHPKKKKKTMQQKIKNLFLHRHSYCNRLSKNKIIKLKQKNSAKQHPRNSPLQQIYEKTYILSIPHSIPRISSHVVALGIQQDY